MLSLVIELMIGRLKVGLHDYYNPIIDANSYHLRARRFSYIVAS